MNRDCACMDRCRGKCGHRDAIEGIKRTVESRLPEDEPDCTAAWVYRVALDSLAAPASPAVQPEERYERWISDMALEELRDGAELNRTLTTERQGCWVHRVVLTVSPEPAAEQEGT